MHVTTLLIWSPLTYKLTLTDLGTIVSGIKLYQNNKKIQSLILEHRVAGVFANLLNIVTLWRQRKLVTYKIFLGMAFADLVVSIITFVGTHNITEKEFYGYFVQC